MLGPKPAHKYLCHVIGLTRYIIYIKMPLQLPGFYWDEARNRYFPIGSTSKPQRSLQTAPSTPNETVLSNSWNPDSNRKPRSHEHAKSLWRCSESFKNVSFNHERSKLRQLAFVLD